ncbi:MAG: glycosyltransferase [Nostocoides sp.]
MNRPHVIYLAWGFPPAAKSCTFRMLATANSFARAGWDVTVITLTEDAWVHEQGVDRSLLAMVDPSIEVRRFPFEREDIATDIRHYSQARAEQPVKWLKEHRRHDTDLFPEVVYGRWRDAAIAAVLDTHAERAADLFVTSATPYTFFAPALALWEQDRVPYVLDYRDSWAIDIIKDQPGFAPDSPQAVFEHDVLSHAAEVWFVNDEIRDGYAAIYPQFREVLHVVRNGSDESTGTDQLPIRIPDPQDGLTFGYLGTVTFDVARMRALCDGWRLAAGRSEIIARSRLIFRGHMGTGSARGHTAQADIIEQGADVGISYGGPVPKAETAGVYAQWDALVLCLVGGRYVTSGKVYEYMSTGLPIVSVHEWDHAAAGVLNGYPLWVRNDGVDATDIADAFVAAADRACAASIEDHLQARTFAHRFERYAQMAPAIARLTEAFGAGAVPREEQAPPASSRVSVQGPDVTTATGECVVAFFTLPLKDKVVSGLAGLAARGVDVHLVGPATVDIDERVADLVVGLRAVTAPVRREEIGDVRRGSPQWVKTVATNTYRRRVLRPVVRRLGLPVSWWMAVSASPRVLQLIDEASLLVALDDGAIAMAWNAARRNPYAPAVNGLGPGLEQLESQLAQGQARAG